LHPQTPTSIPPFSEQTLIRLTKPASNCRTRTESNLIQVKTSRQLLTIYMPAATMSTVDQGYVKVKPISRLSQDIFRFSSKKPPPPQGHVKVKPISRLPQDIFRFSSNPPPFFPKWGTCLSPRERACPPGERACPPGNVLVHPGTCLSPGERACPPGNVLIPLRKRGMRGFDVHQLSDFDVAVTIDKPAATPPLCRGILSKTRGDPA